MTSARHVGPGQTADRGMRTIDDAPRPGVAPPSPISAGARVRLQTWVEAETYIAEGGMATVFRALDHELERPVAMKVLKPGVPALVRRSFEREAKLMARLDHPGIVGVYGLSSAESGQEIFTMKLVEGRTLAATIEREQPPRGRELALVLRTLLRLCETLAYAHDHGVIHRDLKPENIMLGRYGECYVMDWGIALELGPDGRPKPGTEEWAGAPGDLIGTPAFMAPEQARGRNPEVDARTDVYGVGAILYYVLTGRAPHDASGVTEALALAQAGRVEAPELVDPTRPIPARLSDIVSKALQVRREDRYPSAMALHDALEQFLFTGEWFTRQRFVPGELIVREGEQGERAYIVEAGECEVFRAGDQGESVIRRIGPGEIIGELALFTSGERTASIRALTPMTLLELSPDALAQELPEGSWTRQLIDTLARRFVSVDRAWESERGRVQDLALDGARPTTGEHEVTAGRPPRPTKSRERHTKPRPSPADSVSAPTGGVEPAYVAKLVGVTLGLTLAGLLLLKLLGLAL